jgi:hypothetical protein
MCRMWAAICQHRQRDEGGLNCTLNSKDFSDWVVKLAQSWADVFTQFNLA